MLKDTNGGERPAKQVRFGQLVAEGGRPAIYTPWQDPAQDPIFQKAQREGRILTVDRVNVGTRKDAGEVGFARRDNALYLVFPRSIKGYAGRKVIGLNYNLLEEPPRPAPHDRIKPSRSETAPAKAKTIRSEEAKTVVSKLGPQGRAPRPVSRPAPPPKPTPPPAAPKPPPPPPRFRVVLRFDASLQTEVDVEAKNRAEAGTKALRETDKGHLDFSQAKVAGRVVAVKKLSP